MSKKMEKIKKFQILAIMLTVCLATSLAFNVYQFLNRECEPSETSGAKTFVYEWSPGELVVLGQQKITNETLRLELTFKWEEEALSINATINDNDYDTLDYMSLVFDRNGNEVIDVGLEDGPYIFFAGNLTCTAYIILDKTGKVYGITYLPPKESTYHNCTFTEGEGYTFNIRIPKSELSEVKANMVHFYFTDKNVPSLEELESYWVSVMFEGWQ